MRMILAAIVGVMGAAPNAFAQQTHAPTRNYALEEKNKAVVLEFIHAADQGSGNLVERANKYLTPEYIQHDPLLASGRDSFIKFFQDLYRKNPEKAAPAKGDEPEFVMAQGDIVTVMWKYRMPDPTKPGSAYDAYIFDVWRVTNGRLAEHWDSQLRGVEPPL